ncbi:hypothetical protein GQR58_011276 [Nymphon striatum]|nr:hypothetical protein GQR58_011276 [Nymphon striatum]
MNRKKLTIAPEGVNTKLDGAFKVPPQKPVIRDIYGEIVPEIIGPYNEGEPLVLICETRNGEKFTSVSLNHK